MAMTDQPQDFHSQIDEQLRATEKLCAQSEKAWRKGSPQAQKIRSQQMATQVLVDATRQIEKDDSEIHPDQRE